MPGKELKSEKGEDGQIVFVPGTAPDANASVVVVEIEGPPKVLAGQVTPKGGTS